MRKRFFVAAIAAPLLIAACISDEPATPAPPSLPDAASPLAPGAVEAGADAGAPKPVDPIPVEDAGPDKPAPCKFQPTPYPCGGDAPAVACWGAAQSCTLTGCNELRWSCNSPRQCSETACCIAADRATATSKDDCSQGSLIISPGTTTGGECEPAPACPADKIQLCQANSDCPKDKKCKPLKIANGPASINGNIIGACF